MKTPLNILHLEDSGVDAELIQLRLEADNISCAIKRVQTRGEFEAALKQPEVDLIISDFTLPSFDGLSALEMARAERPGLPLIFVSGTIGEEAAVESLKAGAVDYVLKDRLSRLPGVVRRAMREVKERAERRRIEEELEHRNELFFNITENVDDLIAVLDLEGRRVFNSPSYRQVLGDPDTPVGTDSFAEIHPEDRERIKRIFRETVATGVGQRVEYRFLLKDGSVRYVEARGSVIRDKEGRIANVVVVSRDLTERNQAEARNRELAALLDKAPDAICVTDIEQRVFYWNNGAERIYGWTAPEAIGKNANELLFQGDLAASLAALKRIIAQGEWHGELNHVTKGGKKIVVASRWALMRDESGKPESILVINTDITEKKQIEGQLLRAQRMENIGALAAGVAHDLNNVLGPILMVGGLIRDELASEESKAMLDTATASAQRGAEMVKQILSFARGASGERMLLQVGHLVKEMGKLAKDTFPKSIDIRTKVTGKLRTILGDATQLHQVLLNLCVNARDAMPEGGALLIQAENMVVDRKQVRMYPQPVSGPYVVLSVSDTGIGIPPELRDRIFEPFFTTKEQCQGTGLGLSTVMSIIKSHQGFVEVSSQVGKGATFKLYLPAMMATETELVNQEPKPPVMGKGQGILLVDDELAILEITKETLETFNYRVATATDGVEAVTLYRQRKGEINAVVTDLMMPIMDGPALIRALRQIDPQVNVVAVSGLDSRAKLAEAQKLNVQACLGKPYTTEKLLAVLDEVLSGKV
ncbi:MAG: PAS domain S-box protein [Verrucomicrobia bacterium]|nr:MAG: PAS domain S-box protein [Verrucomicrobiota bacterium]